MLYLLLSIFRMQPKAPGGYTPRFAVKSLSRCTLVFDPYQVVAQTMHLR